MIAVGRRAYANARVRARRSRLLRADDAAVVRMAGGADAAMRALAKLGLDAPDVESLLDTQFQRLVRSSRVVLRSYPVGADLVLTLLRRFEIDNIKLVWRALTHRREPAAWTGLWRDLGDLATVSRVHCGEATSVGDLLRVLERTPYEPVARSSLRPHEDGPPAAELALDRWMSRRLVESVLALPAAEADTKKLVLMVVRERDVELLSRGHVAYGLAPDLVAASTVVLVHEASREALTRLAAWQPSRGPLGPFLPRTLAVPSAGVDTWDDLGIAMRQARRRACVRAFGGAPFRLVTGIALLLLEEEELHALAALVEAASHPEPDRPLRCALAASVMGG